MTFEKNSTTQILIITLHNKRLFSNTVLLKQIPNQSQQLSELLFKTTVANKMWYLKQKKFDLRFTKCTSYAGGKVKQKVQDWYSSTHKMLFTPRSEVLLEL